ncbi:YggS family pyridoxal phosphate-dependent enzyme [Desulforhopalus singaporensis]|uniref:Pyridoxal phosphate homeostasis protein n=1 Tax=Desulforhopalus singaporensis TaxID=91360 RepID=A0A1H0MNA3_9BACT|nr:YggS family pyridoxal phosphate-dependent enzyme [Desulforhopalus singaporensis]SDO81918.1 hypothetical protein SAMN05660330_01121 [Desulforhopalus singaporensis]
MIAENIDKIKQTIETSAQKAGRDPNTIKLVAVSKRFPVDKIVEASNAGQKLFGENYVQELQQKVGDLPSDVKIHFIGHLQSNKAKIAAESCDMIETVDRIKLGKKINNHMATLQKKIKILVQVNIGNDPRKAGTTEQQAAELIGQLEELPMLEVCGLMTMPPLEQEPERSRPYFSNLRLFSEKLKQQGFFRDREYIELSMGMSSDFHIAIEEGATIVRVGTAIFGKR